MKIVQIEDSYIHKLTNQFSHVMLSKRFHRTHTRKYIGVVFSIGKYSYYVPFSSPKPNDYTRDGNIRTDDLFVARMSESDGNGGKKLLGTLKFNNMIPVPMMYVSGYSIEKEQDEKYKDIILSELKWVNKNQEYICNKAKKIYDFKSKEAVNKNIFNEKRYAAVLPFEDIEKFLADNKMI